MSYLYKKPVPKPIPVFNEIIVPEIPEKVDIVSSEHITEISYEEHLKNLELMCKKDREFMKRVRFFCEENKEEAFNVASYAKSVSDKEPASEHEGESE
jgi:hypothetical protein